MAFELPTIDVGIDLPTVELPTIDDILGDLGDIATLPVDLALQLDEQLGLSEGVNSLGDTLVNGVKDGVTSASDGVEHIINQVDEGVDHLVEETANLPTSIANMAGSSLNGLFSSLFSGLGVTSWLAIGVGSFIGVKYVLLPYLDNRDKDVVDK
jgi:hypothetical protein